MDRTLRMVIALGLVVFVAVFLALFVFRGEPGPEHAERPTADSDAGDGSPERATHSSRRTDATPDLPRLPRPSTKADRSASETELFVSGLVVEKADGAPVQGASLTVVTNDPVWNIKEYTRLDGRFRIRVADENGPVVLNVKADGFVGRLFYAERGHEDLRIELTRLAKIRGEVLDAVGDPVVAAFVSATRAGEGEAPSRAGAMSATEAPVGSGAVGGMVRTGVDGTFELGVSAGEYRVTAVDGARAPAVSDVVRVEEGGEAYVTITFGEGTTVFGTVFQEPGVPLPNAGLRGIDFEGMRELDAKADENGNYEIPGLAPGRYMLIAGSPDEIRSGLVPISHKFEITGDEPRMRIDLGGEITGVILTGRLLRRGEIVPDTPLQLAANADDGGGLLDGMRSAVTDEAGRFRFDGVQPGPATVFVMADRRHVPVFIDIRVPDVREARIDLEWPGGLLVGRALDANNEPLHRSLAWLSRTPTVEATALERMMAMRPLETAIDEDGAFQFESLAPGSYMIRIVGNAGHRILTDIEVGDGVTDVGDIVVGKSQVILHIVDEAQEPVSRASVWIVAGGVPLGMAGESGEDGMVFVPLDSNLTDGALTIHSTTHAPRTVPLNSIPQESEDPFVVIVRAGGTAEVRVTDASGSPIGGMLVEVRDSTGRRIRDLAGDGIESIATGEPRTDREGRISFPRLAPGSYRATARNPETGTGGSAAFDIAAEQTTPVELTLR